jgi:hypothetical protein
MTGLGTHPSTTAATPETGWADLEAELDIWQTAGRTASFWWRDDDAIAPTPALDRLLALAGDTPVGLAVIPGRVEPGLAERLTGATAVTVLQHGWRHANHARADERKSELGAQRPLRERLDELRIGRERLAALFGSHALPTLVPPWNRIAPDLIPRLPEIGISGLSVDGPRRASTAVAGLRQVNVHVDLVDWHGGRGFVGEARALGLVLRHLRGRYLGSVDAEEPTGILTHHLVHDLATEQFLRRLLGVLRRHPVARLVPITELFP